VPENDGKRALIVVSAQTLTEGYYTYLGILATASIFVRMANTYRRCLERDDSIEAIDHTSVQDLNANFVSLWWSDFNLFNLELFSGGPTNGGFAMNCFPCSVRHCNGRTMDKRIFGLSRSMTAAAPV
jgi:hypothetical protein